MSGIWGKNLRLSIFGESHAPAIGIVIDGLPPGTELDIENIRFQMNRRAPGRNKMSTPRGEKDEFEILSGYFNGKTTGTPLACMIRNADRRSSDYENISKTPRPGHADYTGFVKYGGFNDYRGGGHFSGRLTAPLVFAGAIAQQILEGMGIVIAAHAQSVAGVCDTRFEEVDVDKELVDRLKASELAAIDTAKGELMKSEILKAREELDSVGGVIECMALGIPAGLGDPFFDSVESRLSGMLFSIPAVKGVEFGAGFEISRMRGSKANDEYVISDGQISTSTNNNGGILGGITSGMPMVFRAAIKPTPSISQMQSSVDISSMKEVQLRVEGRHDPCIVPRAIPVVESAAALVILDMMLEGRK